MLFITCNIFINQMTKNMVGSSNVWHSMQLSVTFQETPSDVFSTFRVVPVQSPEWPRFIQPEQLSMGCWFTH